MIAEKRKLFFFFSFKHRLATPQQAVHAACLNSQPSSIREQLDRLWPGLAPGNSQQVGVLQEMKQLFPRTKHR